MQRLEVGRVAGGGGGEAIVVDPVGTTSTGTRGASRVSSRVAVKWLTATSTAARSAAARIIRRKRSTFVRSCHSGWSKNVRSWIVTTAGVAMRSGIV
ncbi:MAG: hypothetical protein M5U14_14025 [Acidimicrobiia bacterium]|nr:hypothetical protein [Acidimicrobiia bacterium]